jgi:hypothetical protein
MMHILLHKVLLLQLPNQCFQQLSGLSLPELLRQLGGGELRLNRKRKREQPGAKDGEKERAKKHSRGGGDDEEQLIPRWRIFYCEHFPRRCHGLPNVRPLNVPLMFPTDALHASRITRFVSRRSLSSPMPKQTYFFGRFFSVIRIPPKLGEGRVMPFRPVQLQLLTMMAVQQTGSRERAPRAVRRDRLPSRHGCGH